MLLRCLINLLSLWNQVRTSFDAVYLKNPDIVAIDILGATIILGAVERKGTSLENQKWKKSRERKMKMPS